MSPKCVNIYKYLSTHLSPTSLSLLTNNNNNNDNDITQGWRVLKETRSKDGPDNQHSRKRQCFSPTEQ